MPSKIKIIIGEIFHLLEHSRLLHPAVMRQNLRSSKQRQRAKSLCAPKYFPHAQFGKLTLAIVLPLAIVLTVVFSAAGAMTEMKDSELSDVSGQALMQMGKELGTGVSSDVTFYKAGLDAELELNMNIEKLQLGCTATAINGQHCDIDIDQMSLTGQADINGNFPDGRAATSALLTRPFFEFAIKNDDSKTLREVVGIRMSAENAKGMLTLGDQQAGSSDPGNKSGINSLSGYMVLGATSGVASTEARPMDFSNYTCQAGDPCTGTYAGLGRNMEGRIYLDAFPIYDAKNFSSQVYRLFLNATAANVSVPSTVVTGKRLQSAGLQGTATIGQIDFAGEMRANVEDAALGIDIELGKTVTGSISGLTADVPINQSLKFIHKINVDSPFSLSMQQEDVLWPDAAAAAQAGWWMAFEDEIDIGNISPEDDVPITNQVLLDALGPTNISWTPNPVPSNQSPTCNSGPSINCALHTALSGPGGYTYDGGNLNHVYGVECQSLSNCLGGSLAVGNLHVPANLDFPLEDLKLSGQSVTANCFGSARFC